MIDRNKIYEVDEFRYVNYTSLAKDDLLKILAIRNSDGVRKHMLTSSIIKEEDHLNYVESLKQRNDVYYWVIMQGEEMVGFFNVAHIDEENKICVPGIFYKDTSLEGVMQIIDIVVNTMQFVFDKLGFTQLNAQVHTKNKFMQRVNNFVGYVDTGSDGEFILQTLTIDMFHQKLAKELTCNAFLKTLTKKV